MVRKSVSKQAQDAKRTKSRTGARDMKDSDDIDDIIRKIEREFMSNRKNRKQ